MRSEDAAPEHQKESANIQMSKIPLRCLSVDFVGKFRWDRPETRDVMFAINPNLWKGSL